MSIFEKIEKALDKAPPNDDVQKKLDSTPFLIEYKKKIALSALAIVLAFISLLAFYLMAKNMRPPNLVLASYQRNPAVGATGGMWAQQAVTPMLLPNQSQESVKAWARETVQKVYTFDFKNMNDQLGSAQPYFTPDGWDAFKKVFKFSELFKTVEKNRLSVAVTPTAQPIMGPVAATKGAGEYAWKVICPVTISFSGDTPTKNIDMVLTVTVIRVPTTENPKGLGVLQLVAGSTKG